jgi:hypothetical protein
MPPVEKASAGGLWGALPRRSPFPGCPSSIPVSVQRDLDAAKQAPASPDDIPNRGNLGARQVSAETP